MIPRITGPSTFSAASACSATAGVRAGSASGMKSRTPLYPFNQLPDL